MYAHGQAQAQGLARHRCLLFQHSQNPPAGVGFHLPVAHFAVQGVFIEALDATASVEMRAGIVALLVQGHGVQVLDVDPIDVTQHVGKRIPWG